MYLIVILLDRSNLAELRRTRVCISDFEMLQMIGRGHFGEVHVSIFSLYNSTLKSGLKNAL